MEVVTTTAIICDMCETKAERETKAFDDCVKLKVKEMELDICDRCLNESILDKLSSASRKEYELQTTFAVDIGALLKKK